MERAEYQVYLSSRAKKIRKKFRRVCNPKCSDYGKYGEVEVVSLELREKALRYFSKELGLEVQKTYFPDVLVVKATRDELFGQLLPKWVDHVEKCSAFEEVCRILEKTSKSTSVEVLPLLPPLNKGLKERVHLECMIQGVLGRTLLASADSVWAEFPSVTIFTERPKPIFSPSFNRKREAPYQNHFVNTYLRDPEIKRKIEEISFERHGRAAPDIYLDDVPRFVNFLRRRNGKRIKIGLPTLGFLNYFLYQNAYAFKRPLMNDEEFPDSVALWNANRGLGAPHYYGLKQAIKGLFPASHSAHKFIWFWTSL